MGRTRRTPTLVGCMLAMGTVALDSTVLATAIPSIAADLGGFTLYPWVFSVNFLAQAVTIPVFGKLADVLGRRWVLLAGATLFLSGAVLSSLAWSMPALIAARAVQGVGAGAIQPVTQTIVGDLYEIHERGRPQGLMSSVWGFSAVLGPVVGGLLAEYVSWRWIFSVDLPVGLAAVAMILLYLHEDLPAGRRSGRRRLDLLGMLLLTCGVSLLIVGLLESGVRWPWASGPAVGTLGAGAVLLLAFGWQERRAANPIVPPWLFHRGSIVGANGLGLLIGLLMIGATAFLPAFAQGVLGANAVVAGFTLGVMSFGWPFASAGSARLYMRMGFRNAAMVGCTVVAVATLGLAVLPENTTVWHVGACSFVLGIGLGLQMTPLLVGVQHSVEWDQRGVITGAFVFARTLGNALGAALFGALAHSASTASSGHGLYLASHRVFLGMAAVAVLGLGLVLATPHFGPSAELRTARRPARSRLTVRRL
jgi:EmrB/QacA subfamily drug resistance transporter